VRCLPQQLAAVAANLNGDPESPVEEHSRYRDAVAQHDEARGNSTMRLKKAPFAGIVTDLPAIVPGKRPR